MISRCSFLHLFGHSCRNRFSQHDSQPDAAPIQNRLYYFPQHLHFRFLLSVHGRIHKYFELESSDRFSLLYWHQNFNECTCADSVGVSHRKSSVSQRIRIYLNYTQLLPTSSAGTSYKSPCLSSSLISSFIMYLVRRSFQHSWAILHLLPDRLLGWFQRHLFGSSFGLLHPRPKISQRRHAHRPPSFILFSGLFENTGNLSLVRLDTIHIPPEVQFF